MKLRAVRLSNVRRFTSPVSVAALGDGLNVLSAPNEHGKSTLFDAVQALFFKPHGSADKEIKALKPHAGGAPEVTVEVETAEGRFAITKRWLSKPLATVMQDGRLVAQADAAEDWIARLVGSATGGPSGLVWVRQGMASLAVGSKKDQEASLEARRDLMSSVTGEVEAMTGGRRMDVALARCKEELSLYMTPTGQKKAGGPWREVQDRSSELRSRCDELAQTAKGLHDALIQRKRKRTELAELESPENIATRKKRLEDATQAHKVAERHADTLEAEARNVEALRTRATAAADRLETFREASREKSAAETQAIDATTCAEAARSVHDSARTEAYAAQQAQEEAQSGLRVINERHREALRQHTAREGTARRAQLADQISRAEEARTAMEDAAAASKIGPDARALRKLEDLEQAVTIARATRNAGATQLAIRYEAGADGRVQMDGAALIEGGAYPISTGVRLVLQDIGDLEIRPASPGESDTSVEDAEAALQTALHARSLLDLDDARAAAAARAEATRRFGEARASYTSLAPDGIDHLRGQLAAILVADDSGEDYDIAVVEHDLRQAEEIQIAAQSRYGAAGEALATARAHDARAEAAESAANDRLRRANAAIVRLGDTSETVLIEEAATTAGKLRAAENNLADERRKAPDLAAANASLTRAKAIEESARSDISRLRPELAALNERITRSSGEAVEELLEEARQGLQVAEADLARITREVAVLQRLEAALETARNEARERYFEPVARELKPLLHLLWPEADLTWGDDTLLPVALVRDGQTEPIDILSGGTQEQIALLVRLAFARMLAKAAAMPR